MDMATFDPKQDAYVALCDLLAERTTETTWWVGSGLSASAGLPTWPALHDRLAAAGATKAVNLDSHARADLLGRLEALSHQPSYWHKFALLRGALGPNSYRSIIRDVIGQSDRLPVPEAYRTIWQLRPSAILTLNIDRFVSRAYAEVYPGKPIHQFPGRESARYFHLLQSPQPLVVYLHGWIEDEATWVFTIDELRTLLMDPGYRQLIAAFLATHVVVFAGCSADDVAVGGHLSALKDAGISLGNHFWITSRADKESDDWAEATGVRVIRYPAADGDHGFLLKLLSDLRAFVPTEPSAPPVVLSPGLGVETTIESPEVLLGSSLSGEELRARLNACARELLAPATCEAYDRYARFVADYDEVIYRAWFVSTQGRRNVLFGYRLEEQIAYGGFGRVFRALSPSGEQVAIKVLREDIRREPERLQGFRRGVRSMRILANRGVGGVVLYRDASEIPACVVMEFIEGPNLAQAVEARRLTEWSDLLRVASEVARIVRNAHSLPERVLHRDIRPANIMLKRFYTDPTGWEVVVLDFDLSWHVGALELSVPKSPAAYLAPEQVYHDAKASTRNAAVDSYSFGMTLYYVISGIEPQVGQHRYEGWADVVLKDISRRACGRWRSLPSRIARLVVCATRERQSDRWDMSQILGELERLQEAERGAEYVRSAELLAEEVMARSEIGGRYRWDSDGLCAKVELGYGVECMVEGHEVERAVVAKLNWGSRGDEDWKRMGKWVPTAMDRAGAALRKKGWAVKSSDRGRQQIFIVAKAGVEDLRERLDDAVAGLDAALVALQFS